MTYRRIGAALVLLLALTRPLSAQVLNTGTITAQDAGSCATATGCVTFSLPPNVTALLFQVSGTFSGTLTFEATADPSSATTQTWFSLGVTKGSDGTYSTTTTGTGQFSAPGAGSLQVRVRAGSFASGTATISLNRGYFVSRLMYPIFTTVTANSFVGGTFSGTSFTGGTFSGSTYTATTGFLAPGTVPIKFGDAQDVCLAHSGTKTVTLNDCAGSAATLAVTGLITGTTITAGSGGFVTGTGGLSFTSLGDFSMPTGGVLQTRNSGASAGLRLQFNGAPTLTSCGTGSVSTGSTDTAGEIVATGATACTITFNATWASAPFCTATNETTAASPPRLSAKSTTAVTFSNLTSGDTFMYHCLGAK